MKRRPHEVRKLGNDYFTLQGIWSDEKSARSLAVTLRNRGKRARVVRVRTGWGVYKGNM